MISGKGINHTIINRIKEYPLEHFTAYCHLIINEFEIRRYKIGENAIGKLNLNIGFKEY